MNAKRQLHENSRTTALEIFAIKRKLDSRMSLHTLHIVQGFPHQRERLFGKSDGIRSKARASRLDSGDRSKELAPPCLGGES